ncbi:MAG: ABC transporter ATP-binding protein [Saprospiraceae bacterium]|nr:ABC transporter ATP-binding protein [Saprospiraceae bacterium]
MTIARLQSAKKEYQTGDTVVTALHRTDLEVQEGEVLLIIGPSGSGKTTLLSLLGCVIYPTEGTVVVDGRELNRLNDRELAALRLKVIGFVFQTYNLISPLTAEENVAFPLLLDGRISRKEALGRAREALAKVNLSAKCRSLPRQLSSGEQQRTAIARALVTDPPILLCDEPTAALDEVSFDRVMLELQALARQGKAVVIVTHDPRLKPYADRVITVVGGRVLAAQKDTNE